MLENVESLPRNKAKHRNKCNNFRNIKKSFTERRQRIINTICEARSNGFSKDKASGCASDIININLRRACDGIFDIADSWKSHNSFKR